MSTQAEFVTGCDVVDIARLDEVIDRRPGFVERVFTERERADARRGGVAPGSWTERSRLAARFAAKEATRKALGALDLGFHAVEVRSEPDGAPCLWVRGEPSGLACSLSHDAGVALAVIVGSASDRARLLAHPTRAADQAAEPDPAV
jgi:holo-[acyl-carrier protein] synthase